MILLRNLRLNPGEKESGLKSAAAKKLRISERDISAFRIRKKSLDARKKSDIHWEYAISLTAPREASLLKRCRDAEHFQPYRYEIPEVSGGLRPVVVGFGPAGMFAALLLAEAGLRPLVLERGADIETRREAVRAFWEKGVLSEESNVQFGEGGAGTFSDGKLGTGTHDSRIRFVLEQFVRFGAPENVAYDAKPHVGTDVLATVVKNLRHHIETLGGEVRFCARMNGLETENGMITAVRYEQNGNSFREPCREVVLAPGHSARDTFAMLRDFGIAMERKAFAMGVRIEHSQKALNEAQYGSAASLLPPADYKLNTVLPDGSSAYTFCMCPGGYVVAAASELGGVCTNGMSYSGRSGDNANSALLVTLKPEDFPGEGVLAGCEWQREIEQNCFRAGGSDYSAPAQTVADFLSGTPSTGPGEILPTYRPGVHWCDLNTVLPERLTKTLRAAIPELGKILHGFDCPDAVLTAPETRSSSPVRILRNRDSLQASVSGLYPCGEGAGYAGGITSAAVDGMRAAEQILNKYRR